MKFRYVNKSDGDMVDTPYAADRATKTIYINPALAKNLSIFEKKFWILHEKGHIVLNTSDEIQADNYAFDRLAGSEYRSLKQMIEAEENLLNPNSKYHQARIDNLYRRAIEWDKAHPVKTLDKATSGQITSLGIQMNNLAMTMGTLMNKQTLTTAEATQTGSNSNSIMIMAVLLVVVLVIMMKK